MKFFSPVKKHYLYLSSQNAEIVNNLYFKWNIPPFFIRNGEVKLKSVNAVGLPAANTYVMRLKSPMTDNSYNSTTRDPVLFISRDLNDIDLNDTPELRIHNKTINEIIINITAGILVANVDAGINNAIVFILSLEFTDYEPELTSIEYKVNENQNYNRRII